MNKPALLLILGLGATACATDPDLRGVNNPQEASRINTQLGVDYFRKGENAAALDKLRRATVQDPGNAVAQSTLALVQTQLGDFKAADKAYRNALAIDASNPDVQNNYGVFLCGRGRLGEAEQMFTAAAQNKKYSTPAAAWTNAGVCLRKADPERAELMFRNALEADPRFADALANMAWVTWQDQDYLRTRAFLQRYEQVAQPTAETLWIGAQTERALGDSAAAQRYERRLKAEFPESEEASRLSKKP